jgi:predicted metal-binding protein
MNDTVSTSSNANASLDANDSRVIISICTTCKTQDAVADLVGPNLLAAVRAAVDPVDPNVAVRAVQCLGVCKRPTTATVSGRDRYTFVFADLAPEDGATALRDFANSYRRAEYGLVPWRERATVLRRGMIARIPPAIWSPDDGAPPK